MAHRQTADSHPICPTCQSDLSGRKGLAYLACDPSSPLANDEVYHLYEETSRLVYFLNALAQAGPLAVAQYAAEVRGAPDWMPDLVGLAEELTEETARRLSLLHQAGRIWQTRAERTTTGEKEG
jgi:hypothetical protein